MDTFPRQVATYAKAIKVTVDGPREPRSKTSKSKLFIPRRQFRTMLPPPPTIAATNATTATGQRNKKLILKQEMRNYEICFNLPTTIQAISSSISSPFDYTYSSFNGTGDANDGGGGGRGGGDDGVSVGGTELDVGNNDVKSCASSLGIESDLGQTVSESSFISNTYGGHDDVVGGEEFKVDCLNGENIVL